MSRHENPQIDFVNRHGHISDRMSEHATKKVQKLVRYNDQISRIEVIVDGPHDSPEVEVIVHVDNHDPIVARDRNEHFSAAIDGIVEKLEKQLIKAKEKLKDRRS
ncbi:MAG: ribosome-associated translation inhibitor RaiA [Planctomycetota bacterium]